MDKKTIIRQIEDQIDEIKDEICDKICKHHEEAENMSKFITGDDEDMRQQLVEVIQTNLDKKCKECPLNRL